MADKTVNYTPELTAKIVSDYTSGISPEAIAEATGKTVRSIVAKLSREGVYKRKEYVGKTGEKPIRKDATADQVGVICGLTDGETDSLTKANKTALLKILSRLQDV